MANEEAREAAFTPTTTEVRERWMEFDGGPDPDDAAEFDRWLAARDMAMRAEGIRQAVHAVEELGKAGLTPRQVLDGGLIAALALAANAGTLDRAARVESPGPWLKDQERYADGCKRDDPLPALGEEDR